MLNNSIYLMLEMTKLQIQRMDLWLPGVKERWCWEGVGVAINGNTRDSCWDGNVLYLDYINVKIPVVIVLQVVTMGRNWIKVQWIFLYYFLYLFVNL